MGEKTVKVRSKSNTSIRAYIETGLLSLGGIKWLYKKRARFPCVPELTEEIVADWFGHQMHVCFVCSPTIRHGLNLKFFQTNQGGAACRWQAKEGFENYPGMIHGGITTTILDELLGFAIYHETGTFAVSIKAKVRWHKPMKVGDNIIGWARIKSSYKQYFKVEGFLYHENGDCIQTMSGLYCTPNVSLFRRLTGIGKIPDDFLAHFYQE